MFSFLQQKECFTPTYLDSEQYYRQHANVPEQNKVNDFSPAEQPHGGKFQTGYNNPYVTEWTKTQNYSPISSEQMLNMPQQDWIKDNSLYNKKTINGIPLKDYYDTYTKEVLENGTWFLNKDMPQETKQYLDDSQVQQRMEMYTGLRQQRDRDDLGVPVRRETKNLFTPEERITGYGYQYGQSGKGGPGFEITRQKEIEDLKSTMKFKTNEQPIEKIHVGPGLSIGSELPAAGGFQQYTRIVPDNISDYKANQLPGTVAGGKWLFSNAPVSQQPVMKNRPNAFYSLCQYGPMPYGGVITAESTRPDYAVTLKNQNRTVINYGFGTPLTQLNDYLETN
jgi:hypothetical protein